MSTQKLDLQTHVHGTGNVESTRLDFVLCDMGESEKFPVATDCIITHLVVEQDFPIFLYHNRHIFFCSEGDKVRCRSRKLNSFTLNLILSSENT